MCTRRGVSNSARVTKAINNRYLVCRRLISACGEYTKKPYAAA